MLPSSVDLLRQHLRYDRLCVRNALVRTDTPDPVAAPDAYNVWLRMASLPSVQVVQSLDQPMPGHGSGTIVDNPPPGWSGGMFDETLSGSTFEAAQADFIVPSATPTTSCSAAYIWAGLGGWYNSDLIQAGVQYNGNSTVVTTQALKEYWSGNGVCKGSTCNCYATECGAGINIAAGQEFYTQEWACDSNQKININGGYGCFYVLNVTTQTQSTSSLQQINTFVGATGEIIAEDNGPNNWCNSSGTYTKFAALSKAGFWAFDPGLSQHTWNTDSGFQRMLNANSSNQLLGMSVLNTTSGNTALYWMQGQ